MSDLMRNLTVSLLVFGTFACGDAEGQSRSKEHDIGGQTSTSSGGSRSNSSNTDAQGGATEVSSAGGGVGGEGGNSGTQTGGGTTAQGGTTAAPDPNGTGGTMSDEETPVKVHGKLHVAGTRLLDEHDAKVQLKGPSSMWLNWENSGYASNLDGVRHLRNNWKATVIRAAMGVDATGAYLTNPDAMKTRLRAVVDVAVQLGMYVIIDWHDHAAEKHQAQAVEFFTEMATTYGNLPNVIYETYNEPLKVDWNTVVKPYHEAVVTAIRAVDPDNIIVLGTPNWSQAVDVAATSPLTGTNLMYTLHFYACTHTQWLRNKAQTALDAGLPLFVTEWGATNADGGTTGTLCLDEAQRWHDFMNTNGVSWAAWKFDDCRDLSCFFKPGTPVDGTFTADQLNGHGPFVRDRMRE
ncbi:MAG: glycoside hydrolase family 5 protein [Polyangiaceae bacterium]